ncbi:hypothetical protein [Porphyromonas gulae]|nr:hypothetical protein [Porphyromonas gulae]
MNIEHLNKIQLINADCMGWRRLFISRQRNGEACGSAQESSGYLF